MSNLSVNLFVNDLSFSGEESTVNECLVDTIDSSCNPGLNGGDVAGFSVQPLKMFKEIGYACPTIDARISAVTILPGYCFI